MLEVEKEVESLKILLKYLSMKIEDLLEEKTENPLAAVQSRTTEILATIDNPNEEDFSFRINQSNSEYTEIGWMIWNFCSAAIRSKWLITAELRVLVPNDPPVISTTGLSALSPK